MFKTINGGKMPKRGSKYSACVDLFANEDVVIKAGDEETIGLGVCIDLEMLIDRMIERSHGMWIEEELIEQRMFLKKSHYLQLMLRSSLAKKGLIIPNGVGIIDLDYEDEIKIIIHNPIKHSNSVTASIVGEIISVTASLNGCGDGVEGRYIIKKGDRIAQVTLLEHKSYLFGIESDVERNGGFGSTD